MPLPPGQRTVRIATLTCVAAAMAFIGINWGLPSRAADPYLFGQRTPWTGNRILALAGGQAGGDRGADVDANPITDRSHLILLNQTDAQRAEIIRRYRLFTYQPDEMITMMSLARMHPAQGDFDPHLYQYGGLWIYGVGAFIQIAAHLHLLTLSSDIAFYLDHPEQFARFYIVARLYCALFAAAGAPAVYLLLRRFGAGSAAAFLGGICYVFLPVVVNMAHEAKPHLPSVVLILWAIVCAMRYVDTGRCRWWLATPLLCGAAFAMVMSGLAAFLILPLPHLLRRESWRQTLVRTLGALAIALAVYALSNPYVIFNGLFHRDRLRSNLGNSVAMYRVIDVGYGARTTAALVANGTSPLIALAGVAGIICLSASALRNPAPKNNPGQIHATNISNKNVAPLLWIPAAAVLLQMILLASGKPGEYGRFALLPDIALMIAAIAICGRLPLHTPIPNAILTLLTASAIVFGGCYLAAFISDSRPTTGRLREAEHLRTLLDSGCHDLAVAAEPAPYCMPPVDLFRWTISLTPRDATGSFSHQPGAVHLWPIESATWRGRPITWADIPFRLIVPIKQKG